MSAAAVRTRDLSHRYGSRTALRGLDLEVPEGSIYALLGQNGAGKTTLLKILLGLLRPTRGEVEVLGKDVDALTGADRTRIGYIAEGQSLPGWMTVRQLQDYLAPLYPTWDYALASQLERRFRLPPDQKIKTFSRGQQMKAAMLAALAPRPRLLIMDEPFTGMDALVKDELVRGLLELANAADCSVLVCSHDIGELEALADWVGVLDDGELVISEPMEVLQERFKAVEIVTNGGPLLAPQDLPPDWLGVDRSGRRLRFLIADHGAPAWEDDVKGRFPGAHRIDVRPASLREVFVAMARDRSNGPETKLEVTG